MCIHHTHTRVVHPHTATQHLARCACISPHYPNTGVCVGYMCVCAALGDKRVCLYIHFKQESQSAAWMPCRCVRVSLCANIHTSTHTYALVYIYTCIYTGNPENVANATNQPITTATTTTYARLSHLITTLATPCVCRLCVCVRVCGLFHGAQQHNPYLSLSLSLCVYGYTSVHIYIYMYMCMCVLPGMTQCVLIWRRGGCYVCCMSRCRAKACVLCYVLCARVYVKR